MSTVPASSPARTQLPESRSAGALVHDFRALERLNLADTGVSRLPPELVIEIFSYLRDIWPPQALFEADIPTAYLSGWMRVLHVCAFWREVALSAPMLWQDIVAWSINPDSLHEILTRSADLGLRLLVEHAEFQSVWFDATVFSRLETLEIEARNREDQPHSFLSHEAPGIRQLIWRGRYSDIPPQMLGPTLPPYLQRLALNCCAVLSDFPLFTSTLTHLKLDSVILDPIHQHSSVAQALDVLIKLPALEYLDLDIFPVIDSVGAPLPHITLPLLKYFSLKIIHNDRHPGFEVALFRYLSIPSTAEIVVHVHMHEHLNHPVYEQLYSLLFSDRSSDKLDFQLSLTSYDRWTINKWNPATKSCVGKRRIDFVLGNRGSDKVDWLPRALRNLITSARPQSLAVWGNAWQNLPNLELAWANEEHPSLWDIAMIQPARCVTVCYCDHNLLWSTLSSKPIMFPHLETIVLTDIFHWREEMDPNDDRAWGFHEDVQGVHECSVDATTLPDMVLGLMYALRGMKDAGVLLREVRVEGKLAEWSGWEGLQSVLNSLNTATTVSTRRDAPHKQTHTLLF